LVGNPVTYDIFGRNFRRKHFNVEKGNFVGCGFANMQLRTIRLKPDNVKFSFWHVHDFQQSIQKSVPDQSGLDRVPFALRLCTAQQSCACQECPAQEFLRRRPSDFDLQELQYGSAGLLESASQQNSTDKHKVSGFLGGVGNCQMY
jgi:hypothetical protein